MRIALLFVVALLAELLSWIPLALGFVVGVIVSAAIAGYELGRNI